MPARDIMLAVLVAALWGTNFAAIKISYECFTPFLQLAVRFTMAALPVLFLVKPPRTVSDWRASFKIALFVWITQLSFLSLGLYIGMPAGLTSLLMQTQTIFTLLISVGFYGYRPRITELLGLTIAFAGLSAVCLSLTSHVSFSGIALVFAASFSVSLGNFIFKKEKPEASPLTLVSWSCIFPPLPMFAASLIFEGWPSICLSCGNLTAKTCLAILYTAALSTLVATTAYMTLLKRHDPAKVTPFALLIPVFGLLSGYVLFDESLSSTQIIACALVLAGLTLNQYKSRTKEKGAPQPQNMIPSQQETT